MLHAVKTLTSYLLNKYVETAIQKGGVQGFSEYRVQSVREANVNKSDLTVVWLDLANLEHFNTS